MKTLILTLCVACIVTLAGCSDSGDGLNPGDTSSNANGSGQVANADNLQSFVLNNCDAASNDEPANITGDFPDDTTTDPTQSVYTQNCLGSQN